MSHGDSNEMSKKETDPKRADNLRKKFLPNSVRDSYNFDDGHPEIREGEIFLTNEKPSLTERRPLLYDFSSTVWGRNWKSRRIGTRAYDRQGNEITREGYRPVFVQRTELEAEGINPDTIDSWQEIINSAIDILKKKAD